ncbi:alpha/beta hydrolase [Leptospira neocaledonica]|uniref:Dipeptidyl aminopeptidase n=1 Tax=Leptospira neocaledonica TaxID=2023192 RepID=A0A2N0A083_9LEPT|nr:alpha/beta hydrolase [Leptospira neocaledonica]PJZ77706.1 dipeptidyl aminopeptidase [Leptospira neocaledonica]
MRYVKGSFSYLLIFAILPISVWNCGKVEKGRFFNDQAYHFQTIRALNDARSDGAETGEVLEAVKNIKEGDPQSWFSAWENLGNQVLERADQIQDPMSRGQAYLRAHNYLRTAEFFLDPEDEKRPSAFDKSVEVFHKGLDSLGVKYEKIRVPYGEYQLNAIYYPGPSGADHKPLIVLVGGFDSTLEELYFVLVRGAYERGFSVLTYEGPGQGSVLRKQNLGFTPEWEKPTKAVLDTFLASHTKPPKTILVGMSLGGYLAPRAAAFDKRFDGVVAYDVLYDFGEVAERTVPGIILWLEKKNYDNIIEFLVTIKSSFSPSFSWGVKNGKWTMKTKTSGETLKAFRAYTLESSAEKINQDVLILAGTEDHFIPIKQVEDFKRKLTNARSVTSVLYDRASGGGQHCQLGAQALWQADFFDWMKRFEKK